MFNEDLSKWNVEKVKSMTRMFEGCTNFNSDLSDWNVKNVEYMSNMFYGCTNFKSDLFKWHDKVHKVFDMSYMFKRCTNFNSDLSRWDVRHVHSMFDMFEECLNFNRNLSRWEIAENTETENMFNNCPIQDNFKPFRLQERPVFTPTETNPNAIHEETGKINLDSLESFFTTHGVLILDTNFKEFAHEKIQEWINLISDENLKTQKKENYNYLYKNRIETCGFNDYPRIIKVAQCTLSYVDKQSTGFKTDYVSAWIDDCLNAYPENSGTFKLSCSKGVVERFYQILSVPCTIHLDENPKEYETLLSILNQNINVLIPEFILEWFKMHNSTTHSEEYEKIKELTKDEKIKHLKNYIRFKFPVKPSNLEEKITKYVNDFTQYLELEDDDFKYGGKRKTIKTTKKIQKHKNKHTHKNKKKSKPTKHHK